MINQSSLKLNAGLCTKRFELRFYFSYASNIVFHFIQCIFLYFYGCNIPHILQNPVVSKEKPPKQPKQPLGQSKSDNNNNNNTPNINTNQSTSTTNTAGGNNPNATGTPQLVKGKAPAPAPHKPAIMQFDDPKKRVKADKRKVYVYIFPVSVSLSFIPFTNPFALTGNVHVYVFLYSCIYI